MVADWLFVIGISTEISGAALIAGEILFESPEQASLRGVTFPTSGEPLEISQTGPAYTWVGAVLLGIGFVLQLLGYVVSAGDDWFFLVSGGTLLVTFLGGRRLADGHVRRYLHRRAIRGKERMIARKYHQDT